MSSVTKTRRIIHRVIESNLSKQRNNAFTRVAIVSDTHNIEWNGADFFKKANCDVLIHCGDHTVKGSFDELKRAAQWLRSFKPYLSYGIISIGGNHDQPLADETYEYSSINEKNELFSLFHDPSNHLYYLNSAPQTLPEGLGLIKIFGLPHVPLTPRRQKMPDISNDFNIDIKSNRKKYLGFNRNEEDLSRRIEAIPNDVDVLITHGPPKGILDLSISYGGTVRPSAIPIGSSSLLDYTNRISALADHSLVLHAFGHEHESSGIIEKGGRFWVNAAAVDGDASLLKQGIPYKWKKDWVPWVFDIQKDTRIKVNYISESD